MRLYRVSSFPNVFATWPGPTFGWTYSGRLEIGDQGHSRSRSTVKNESFEGCSFKVIHINQRWSIEPDLLRLLQQFCLVSNHWSSWLSNSILKIRSTCRCLVAKDVLKFLSEWSNNFFYFIYFLTSRIIYTPYEQDLSVIWSFFLSRLENKRVHMKKLWFIAHKCLELSKPGGLTSLEYR